MLAPDVAGSVATQASANDGYATYLYFHPYIRRFLFDEPRQTDSNAKAALTIYRLAAPGQAEILEVVLPEGQRNNVAAAHTQCFRIVRCLLYQFSLGVLMLEVELEWVQAHRGVSSEAGTGENLALAEALDTLDFLRRTHPAYFGIGEDKERTDPAWRETGGRYPLACTVLPAGSAPDPAAALAKQADRRQSLQANVLHPARRADGYATPLGSPWSTLLGPDIATNCEQIEDDRMPYMAYLAVPQPHDISRSDWVRLAFADHRGDSSQLPYGTAFLADFEARHCYDRYFDRWVDWMSTRYLNTGYAFTMVGSSASQFFNVDGLIHFRRQYACMGLLAQFNKAALLVFSSRLSEATADRSRLGEDAYRERIRAIQRDLLDFSHRYRFEGVSNQLQATELYRDWSRHLALPELHAAVMAEARAAHDYVISEEEWLQTQEERRQTQAANRQAFEATKLNHGALYAAIAGLLLAAMGAGLPFDKPLSLLLGNEPLRFCWLDCSLNGLRLTALLATFVVGIALFLRWRRKRPVDQSPKDDPT